MSVYETSETKIDISFRLQYFERHMWGDFELASVRTRLLQITYKRLQRKIMLLKLVGGNETLVDIFLLDIRGIKEELEKRGIKVE